MQITAISSIYQSSTKYNKLSFKGAKINTFETLNKMPKTQKFNNNLKKLFLASITALALLTGAQSCTKEQDGPHSTGYQPSEIQSNNSNYPNAPQEVMDEFIAWYEENCPIWNWPDYAGTLPPDWAVQREQFQLAIENWWHEHGYPDWHIGG